MATTLDKDMSDHIEDVELKHIGTHEQEALGDDIFEAERYLSLWQAIKAYPRIVVYCLAACSAGLVFGYGIL